MKNNEDSIKEECVDLKNTKLKVDWKEVLAMSIWIALAFGAAIGGGKCIFCVFFRPDIVFDKNRNSTIIVIEWITYAFYGFVIFWVIFLTLFILYRILKIICCNFRSGNK